MNVTATCKVCEEPFNCASRKPLVLPCGHTYCLACLTTLEASGSKLCPACRVSWDCAAYKLPISYMLIPDNSVGMKTREGMQDDYNVCPLHMCPVEHWCCKCQVATCKKCIAEQHYAHSNILLESIFEDEVPIADLKKSFATKIGPKVLHGIKVSTQLCNEGMELVKSLENMKQTLVAWKHRLVVQETHAESCIKASENGSDSLMKVKMEVLLKMMSQCDIEQADLMQQLKIAAAKFSALEAEVKLVHQMKREEELPIFPQELEANALNWIIEGQCKAQRALISVKNGTPLPGFVTIISTVSSPITVLPELLQQLADMKYGISLQLLDSFLCESASSNDSWRLEPLMSLLQGMSLVSFYGHISHSAMWARLRIKKLRTLGLRLEHGGAVGELNKILKANFGEVPSQVWTVEGKDVLYEVKDSKFHLAKTLDKAGSMVADICIGKNVAVTEITEPIQVSLQTRLRLHFVGLTDNDLTWCLQVLKKLLLLRFFNDSGELWLHESTLSKTSIEQLVSGVNKTCRVTSIRLQNHGLTEDDQQQLLNYSLDNSVVLSFSIPRFGVV